MPKQPRKYKSPYQNLDEDQAASATTSRSLRAGKYQRKTITLPPKQIHYIAAEAGRQSIGILAFYRWLIDQGLKSFDEGARPIAPQQVLHETETEHWSSEE